MTLLDKLFGRKKVGHYRSEADHAANRATQLEMSPQTIAALRKHGVGEDKMLPLEFFFYTNAEENASGLSNGLNALGYSSNHGTSAGNKNEYLINGWTTPLKMEESIIVEWTAEMCDCGAKHDCEFDGWGTSV